MITTLSTVRERALFIHPFLEILSTTGSKIFLERTSFESTKVLYCSISRRYQIAKGMKNSANELHYHIQKWERGDMMVCIF